MRPLLLRLGWENMFGRGALSESSRPKVKGAPKERGAPLPSVAESDLVAIKVRFLPGPAYGVGE